MNPADDRLSAALLDLGLVPVDRPLPLVMEQVADLAAEVLGGRPALSVTVVGSEGGSTVSTSSPVAAELDGVQYRTGNGPCLEAATRGRMLLVEDSGTERRWPDLARTAAEAGQRGVVSTPFPSRDAVTGGLDAYVQSPPAPGAGPRERVERFSRHAVVPVANALLHARALQLTEHLQVALESRAVIDHATGILMERFPPHRRSGVRRPRPRLQPDRHRGPRRRHGARGHGAGPPE
ncbi:ANTAR domain-containing protein [Geodermatophilus amargosae]|uniref:ANTAR domain-containing protein n=1 Tax=Geodermatophilus amargosae TaxID=1296565 RepID=A0A1I6YLF0_9ACTN|nr:GAF and ANTAR domain-containing protein [Geodermatophilus amargosae]SFT51316.1 ANTAR domain-containing protein [Geodermatophilus amargosae]